MRTLSLLAAVVAAVLTTGCASTADSSSNTVTAPVSAEAAKPQTVFAARLQPLSSVQSTELADGRLKLSFPGISAFSHDGASLSNDLQQQLTAIAQLLKNSPFSQVAVVGHSDSSGQLAYNNKLSLQRAGQVKAFLLQQGLTDAQLVAEGRGPAEPIADNRTKEGRSANRRVELEIAF